MTDPRVKKYLFDVLTAIEQIERFLGSKRNFKVYQQNAMLRRAATYYCGRSREPITAIRSNYTVNGFPGYCAIQKPHYP